ncbi:hypothetical protein BJX61DRAFT_535938 [Aspergillus egyptiacus]|nr:hypothetical protein BJX61DRAFT_535938 [Aspergillus egyptiacus]
MFDLPDAKRIRRDDLLSRSSSPSPPPSPHPGPEPDPEAAQKRLSALLNLSLDLPPPPTPQEPAQTQGNKPEEEEDEEEQEFEFRLFSAPERQHGADKESKHGEAAAGTTTQKLRIRLRSPTPTAGAIGEGRFVNPFRGWEYYFTTPGLLSGQKGQDAGAEDDARALAKRKEFEDVAVTGEEMMRWAGVPWPGCDLPWRVIRLKREHTKLPPGEKGTSTASAAVTYVAGPPERVPLSRKKPGKKRRIQLRKRAVVAQRAQETEAEKRNRKNRERKMKRRQKARELKAAAGAQGGGGDGSGPAAEPSGEVSAGESD